MGTFMASALSKLFKENEDLLRDARIIGAIAEQARTYKERITTLPRGEGTDIVFQWRIELRTMQDLDDFNAAVCSLMESVEK
jgi:hypothetical protein